MRLKAAKVWISLGIIPSGIASARAEEPVIAAHATGSPSNGTSTVSTITATDALDTRVSSDHSLTLSLGSSLASGKFGAASVTNIWATAAGVRFSSGSLRFNASIPYMRIRSNGTVFTGIDSTPVIVARGTGRRLVHEGVGDLTLGASYALPSMAANTEIELSGRVKVPTASRSSALSSGKTDFSFGAQATHVVGKIAPFASVTYRVFGDTERLRLRNGIAASAGSSLALDDQTILLISYHYAQKASVLISDSHELFAGASRGIADNKLRLSGYVTAGLSRGAAAGAGGVSISVRI
jgi:hypothetical protein